MTPFSLAPLTLLFHSQFIPSLRNKLSQFQQLNTSLNCDFTVSVGHVRVQPHQDLCSGLYKPAVLESARAAVSSEAQLGKDACQCSRNLLAGHLLEVEGLRPLTSHWLSAGGYPQVLEASHASQACDPLHRLFISRQVMSSRSAGFLTRSPKAELCIMQYFHEHHSPSAFSYSNNQKQVKVQLLKRMGFYKGVTHGGHLFLTGPLRISSVHSCLGNLF